MAEYLRYRDGRIVETKRIYGGFIIEGQLVPHEQFLRDYGPVPGDAAPMLTLLHPRLNALLRYTPHFSEQEMRQDPNGEYIRLADVLRALATVKL